MRLLLSALVASFSATPVFGQEKETAEEKIPITREVASLVDQLNSAQDPEDKERTIKQLEELKKLAVPALPALSRALREESSPKVRIAAAEALGKLGYSTPIVVKALIQGLADKYDRVRAESAVSLGKLGSSAAEAIPLLKEKSKTDDDYVRMNSVFALGRIAEDPSLVLDTLTEALKDSNHQCRYSALMALERYGPKASAAIPALLEYGKMEESSLRTRLLFMKTLVSVGKENPEVLKWLIDKLKTSSNPREIIPILNLLGNMGSASLSAAPDIEELILKTKDNRTRTIARDALKKIQAPDPETVEAK